MKSDILQVLGTQGRPGWAVLGCSVYGSCQHCLETAAAVGAAAGGVALAELGLVTIDIHQNNTIRDTCYLFIHQALVVVGG
jgi:hypothetical protein